MLETARAAPWQGPRVGLLASDIVLWPAAAILWGRAVMGLNSVCCAASAGGLIMLVGLVPMAWRVASVGVPCVCIHMWWHGEHHGSEAPGGSGLAHVCGRELPPSSWAFFVAGHNLMTAAGPACKRHLTGSHGPVQCWRGCCRPWCHVGAGSRLLAMQLEAKCGKSAVVLVQQAATARLEQ